MAGESYAHLYCGYWVRHGSEQPYRKLPMLEGFTGLRRYQGNHVELRASTLRFLAPVKMGDVKQEWFGGFDLVLWGIVRICHSY